MEKKDEFKEFLKSSLEEEMAGICFSAEAQENVRRMVLEKENTDRFRDKQKRSDILARWWNREVTVSLKAAYLCLAAVLMITALYTGAFFYVSPQQIAQLEKKQIIIHDGVPFGALQHLVASLDNGRGVGK